MVGALRGVVAIDGPSGTGKTTVARGLAQRLDAGYLDTGAMYRVITLAALRAGTDLADPDAIAELANQTDLGLGTDPWDPVALLDGAEVGADIRTEQVTAAVSVVAAVPAVRELLVDAQRQIIAGVLDDIGGIVVEGRDIGTVVAPDAPLKVFLTASAEIRAARRTAQDAAAGRQAELDAVRVAVERRDHFDSNRAVDPMRAAVDSVEVDTSGLNLEEVLDSLTELARTRDLLATSERGAVT
ncbi:MAG: (d)CMP kinase [Haloechinothrix sp.]